MFLIVKMLVLVGLFRLLSATESPFLCSGIYGTMVLFMGLMNGANFFLTLLIAAIAFGLASLYYWLMTITDEGPFYWPVLIVGLAIIVF